MVVASLVRVLAAVKFAKEHIMPTVPTKDKGPQNFSKKMKEVGRGVARAEKQKASPTGKPKIIVVGPSGK